MEVQTAVAIIENTLKDLKETVGNLRLSVHALRNELGPIHQDLRDRIKANEIRLDNMEQDNKMHTEDNRWWVGFLFSLVAVAFSLIAMFAKTK